MSKPMVMNNPTDKSRQIDAYHRGYASGKRGAKNLRQKMEATFGSWRTSYPASAHLDYAQEVLKLDRERLDNAPSITRFPESKGWPDIVRKERDGFRDGCGCGEVEMAFHFTHFFFMQQRLSTRYIGSPAAVPSHNNGCTAVFMPDSKEGGALYGRNWDMPNDPTLDVQPPRRGPDGVARLWMKGVSCGTMCDEEAEETFPLDAWRALPDDCRALPDVVEFLKRYADFWMACNGIIVDENLNSVAFEKSNRRIGWRYSDDGTAAVTACAQVIPEMKAHREACHRRSLELRGYDESSPDWKYWSGAETRYHRLLKLVEEAAQRDPSLDDMASIVTDHAAPYPQRICLAGETCDSSLNTQHAEWTMRSRAAVLSGPNRRTLFWRVEGQKACYENPPFLVLGEGVEMKPEWAQSTRVLPQAATPDDEMEAYRQYEFDHPNYHPM